jgi:uridine phosphorylase
MDNPFCHTTEDAIKITIEGIRNLIKLDKKKK